MHFLYRCFDAKGKLLYIGASINPLARAYGHALNSPWFKKAAHITLVHLDISKDAVNIVEREAIHSEQPKHNVFHKSLSAQPKANLEYLRYLEKCEKKAAAMKQLRANGWTFQRIATKYKISRQRVHQMLKAKANGK